MSEGMVVRVSNCMYFYGTEDATPWWYLPYPEALIVKRKLANGILTAENTKKGKLRDSHKVKRLCDAIKDIDRLLADKPRRG